jgi:acyl-CoA synthetase (NDP forming)
MRKVFALLGGAFVGLLLLSVACGGGDNSTTTPTPTTAKTATTAATATPAASTGATPTAAELATDLATMRTVLQDTIAKAQAGDVQGTRDAEAKGDKAMEALIKAVRLKDATLADKLEALELHYEAQADSATTDVTVIAQDAQKVIDLFSQVATTLNISEGTPASSAELTTDLATMRTVLQDTIAKAQAGDVQGTRDAEAKGDKAMEALIKAVRLKDATLADKLETLELDYEAQADSTTTDVTVIAQDAQKVLDLFPQVATTLNISY